MSPLRLGLAVAGLTASLWAIGAVPPTQARSWSGLDLRWYFFAVYDAFYGALRAGAPMFWNPYQLCGVPWLGTLQGAFFYPPHVLYLLLPTTWALALSTVLHLALAAGGAAAFARRAGLSAPAATLTAAVFAFAGPIRDWELWPYLLEASAWLPLGAIGVLELAGGRRMRGGVVLAFASGMSWLAGSPQATIFAGYAWATLLLARLVAERPAPAALGGTALAFLGALVAGALLGAVTIFPGLEMAQDGVRRTGALPVAYMYPMGIPPPRRIAGMWLASGSVVLLGGAVLLAPLALVARPRWLALWALVLGGLVALVALGPATPAIHLYLLLPLLTWFRVPHRIMVVAQLCLGVLAGLGLDAAAARARWRAAGVVLLVAIIGGAVVHSLVRPGSGPPLPYRTGDEPWQPGQREAYAGLAASLEGARVWPFTPEFLATDLPPKLPTIAHLRSIEDYEPLTLRRQAEYFGYFLGGSAAYAHARLPFNGRLVTLTAPDGVAPPGTRRRLLDLAAVRLLLTPSPALRRADLTAFVRDAGLEPRPPLAAGIERYENPHALPRAFVTYRARTAPAADELLAVLASASFDPLVESWVEDTAGITPEPDAPARGAAATIVRDDPHVVELDATLAAPGLVVLADTYFRGWTATVDDVPAPILPTNHLFRGVRAPTGTHRVRFTYQPRALWLGAAVSLLAALGLVVAARRLPARPAA